MRRFVILGTQTLPPSSHEPVVFLGADEELLVKKRRRLEKNRLSAEASRLRKSNDFSALKGVEIEFNELKLNWHKRELQWIREKTEIDLRHKVEMEKLDRVCKERDELLSALSALKISLASTMPIGVS